MTRLSLVFLVCLACARQPSAEKAAAGSPGEGAPASSSERAEAAKASASLTPAVNGAPSATPSSSAPSSSAPGDSIPTQAATAAADPLRGPDGAPLPQTEDKPSADSEVFQKKVELLARAIIEDKPELAADVFFPLVAYEQVKDVQKPERDWKFRLMAAFERDIHGYHRDLGRDRSSAKLAGVEVPMDQARWMKPGSEGNKLGYYRVLRSRLRFTFEGGKKRDLELTSLISWRGEWYVVHLNGFK